MIHLQIEVTESEYQEIQILAQELGYDSLEAYVKSLMFEPSREELLEDITESLLAARRGDPMMTWEEMWTQIEQENDDSAN